MKIPVDKLSKLLRTAGSAKKESDTPVRVSVYLDASVSTFLVSCVREAFVPQTTGGIVRVERIEESEIVPKTDTDVALVLSNGSNRLQSAVQEIIIGGAPVCILSEDQAAAPFVKDEGTPMLGFVASSDKTYLLETLARWILDRTEKDVAFASNFPFMRIAASNRIITSCALTNMATGALVFIPGADFPVMVLSQAGMLVQLASIFGKPMKPERGYEFAGIVASGYVLRAITRSVVKQTPHISFLVKALVAGAGTYAMGKGLVALYERDVDYARANQAVATVAGHVRHAWTFISDSYKGDPLATTIEDIETAA